MKTQLEVVPHIPAVILSLCSSEYKRSH